MLTISELREAVPAAFADKPAAHVSARYNFVPTMKVVEPLLDSGWNIVEAGQASIRSGEIEDINTTKHRITLRPGNFQRDTLKLGFVVPTITLVNAHDWSSTFQAFLGMWRKVCGNGMIINAGDLAAYNIRHDAAMEDLQTILSEFVIKSENIVDTAERWNLVDLSQDQEYQIANEAARARFGEKATHDHAVGLLKVRRQEDYTNSLWSVYNRVQENGMMGGVKVGRARRFRKINNIGRGVEFNTALFDICSEMASRVGA